MSTELDKLKQAFADQEVPAPDTATKKAAIAAAMREFEQEKSTLSKGSPDPTRLKNTSKGVFNFLFRRRSMDTNEKNFKPLLIGGASFAVLTVAVLNTQFVDQSAPLQDASSYSRPSSIGERGKLVGQEQPAPASPSEELVSEMFSDIDGVSELVQSDSVPATVTTNAVAPQSVPEVSKALVELAKSYEDVPIADASPVLELNTRLAPQKSNKAMAPEVAGASLGGKYASGRLSQPHAVAPMRSENETMLRSVAPLMDMQIHHEYREQGRDKFSVIKPNGAKTVAEEPVSTFSIDVDTASYSFLRAALNNNSLPQSDAVRIEELINYFPYNYLAPQDKSEPFRTQVSVLPTPWNSATKLLHIGIKGYELPTTEQRKANLVFLIDGSGSMNAANKLPLLRNSFKLLLSSLNPSDTIAIVTYAGSAGTVLEPTPVADKHKIIASLDRLRSGGSTAGGEGIRQAYQLAEQNYDKSAVNRVILATDGDFNVGIRNPEELKSYVERKRNSGVYLSVLGFGMGNYNDELMQTLAQNGNGNAAYIDSLSEARKVLVEEAGSTLFTIAKDVKIQVEFNPHTVAEYRLIGYETRQLNREDFNNDKVDAGDIGSGHSVTAIYEITPSNSAAKLIDELRYKNSTNRPAHSASTEYAFLKMRYKLPNASTSTLISTPITPALESQNSASAPQEARFATAVAAFGQLVRGGRYTKDFSYDDVIALAHSSKGDDEFGYRAEFINLVRLAKSAAGLPSLQR
jgi:Ca-activated chloride channel family protein